MATRLQSPCLPLHLRASSLPPLASLSHVTEVAPKIPAESISSASSPLTPSPASTPTPVPTPLILAMAQVLPYAMPLTGEKHAPTFDPTQLRSLARYFTNLESLFQRAVITDEQERKVYACRYVDYNVVDDWENLDEYLLPATYLDFKTAVYKLYPGADAVTKYTRAGLQQYVREVSVQPFRTLRDWAEFFRTFSTQTKWLIAQAKISMIDQRRWCADAIGPKGMNRIQNWLMLKKPDVHPSDDYNIGVLDEAMRFLLQGTALTPSRSTVSATGLPTTQPTATPAPSMAASPGITIKTEDMSCLLETLARLTPRSSPAPTASIPQSGPSSTVRAPPATMNTACYYCNEQGHDISTCPAVDEDVTAGKC